MFLTFGFEKPTPEVMGAWGSWFKSIGERIADQGGFWNGGQNISDSGTSALPFGPDSITGFLIFTAKDLAEASKLAKGCPVVANNQLFEIMTK
tara:strand:- start:16011 stop:16289 length:279 start_codon:yes stop_codon:yes gene_type:complete